MKVLIAEGTPIVSVNLYDPELELFLVGQQDLAKASVGVIDQINKIDFGGSIKEDDNGPMNVLLVGSDSRARLVGGAGEAVDRVVGHRPAVPSPGFCADPPCPAAARDERRDHL